VIDYLSNYFFLLSFSRCDKALAATDLLAALVLLSLSTFEAVEVTLALVVFLPLIDLAVLLDFG
jgi:hypothetical protein